MSRASLKFEGGPPVGKTRACERKAPSVPADFTRCKRKKLRHVGDGCCAAPTRSGHVPSDHCLAYLHPQLQQLPVNARGTPCRVGFGQAPNQRAQFRSYPRPPHPTPGLPAPDGRKPNRCHFPPVAGGTRHSGLRQPCQRRWRTTQAGEEPGSPAPAPNGSARPSASSNPAPLRGPASCRPCHQLEQEAFTRERPGRRDHLQRKKGGPRRAVHLGGTG